MPSIWECYTKVFFLVKNKEMEITFLTKLQKNYISWKLFEKETQRGGEGIYLN